ncbi:MAG: hypothetical protein P8129_13385, partial [Anaerolineae bacterium]
MNEWARSLAGKNTRFGAALSPWVQRSLAAGVAPAGASRQRAIALTEAHTHALLRTIQRKVEGARAWRPELGPATPFHLDRFGGEIVQRYAPFANRHVVETADESGQEGDDLVLASMAVPEMGRPPGAFASESWMASAPPPSAPHGPPPPTQPPPSPRPPQQRIEATRAVQRRRDIRPMSQVEEITPGAKTAAPPPSPPAAEPGLPAQDEGLPEQPPADEEVTAAQAEWPEETEGIAPAPQPPAEGLATV